MEPLDFLRVGAWILTFAIFATFLFPAMADRKSTAILSFMTIYLVAAAFLLTGHIKLNRQLAAESQPNVAGPIFEEFEPSNGDF